MKFISLGLLLFALSFCGIADKIKQMSGGANTGTSNTASNSGKTGGSSQADPAKPSSAQQSIIDSSTETPWADQGLSWRLPAGWKKMEVKKDSFNYESPDLAFLLVNISELGDSFPMDTSLQAYYDQAMQQLKS